MSVYDLSMENSQHYTYDYISQNLITGRHMAESNDRDGSTLRRSLAKCLKKNS